MYKKKRVSFQYFKRRRERQRGGGGRRGARRQTDRETSRGRD